MIDVALVVALTPPADVEWRDWQETMHSVVRAIASAVEAHAEGWSPNVTMHIEDSAERVLAVCRAEVTP